MLRWNLGKVPVLEIGIYIIDIGGWTIREYTT